METHTTLAVRNDTSTNKILFHGVTFTSTNLSSKEKSQITDMVATMGGKINNDLTGETNVLIVGDINTAKSKYCLKHRTDVTLLYPDDLMDIYKRFKERTMPRLTIQILDEYPWPIFSSCLFCLSRLRDVENPCYEKNYITKLIEHFGGKSIASLTPKVTYLITDKREGKRYESAIEWNIHAIHPKWIIDCCNCQRILNPALYDISSIRDVNLIGKNSHKNFRQVIDYGSTINNPIYSKLQQLKQNQISSNAINNNHLEVNDGLFKGFIFSCFGFNNNQYKKLSQILKTNGAEIQEDYDLSVTHVLIPSTFTYDEVPNKVLKLKDISDSKIVNEWFIERCLHYGNLCNDSWSLPPKKLYLDYKLKIHITGFIQIEHLHITKLIKNLNLTLRTELTDDCDFLIANLASLGLNKANSPQLFKYKFHDILSSKTITKSSSVSLTKKKINSAKKWNIPVVSLAFLWELSQTGVLPSVLDTEWCIFAPRSMRPASNFLEYARSVSGGTFHTNPNISEQTDDNDDDNDAKYADDIIHDEKEQHDTNDSLSKLPVQLPSPRKNSTKKWPKLIGTASESQLKSRGASFNDENIVDDDDDEYNFRGKRRLLFGNATTTIKDPKVQRFIEFEDDFGVEEVPVFKKRRK